MKKLLRLLTLALLWPVAVNAAGTPLQGFQRDVSAMVDLRSNAYRFAAESGITKRKAPALTRQQGNQLRELGHRYLELRARLLPRAEAVSSLFAGGSHRVLTTEHASGEIIPGSLLGEGRDKLIERRWLNPLDAAGRAEIRDIQVGLAAALVLMDSYQIAVEPYASNSTMAWLLTYDVDSGQSLARLQKNYHSLDYRGRLASATQLVDEYMRWRRASGQPADRDEDYLYGLIQSTLWYVTLRNQEGGGLNDALHYLAQRLDTRQKNLRSQLSYGISLGFGNMVGLVETRQGKLHAMNENDKDRLARELKPLDILLEKTPFRLTDKMIPGHYGHVAIWLGSEQELREIGAWDSIPPALQRQIRNGGRIVEALRTGVTISTLDHFLNIDDLLVLRDQRPTDMQYRRTAILTALDQVGKEYDFNFDVLTHQRIVCSELAYVVFPDVRWPLQHTLGRYTISPDNVAQLALGQQPVFVPAVLYHDGQRIDQDRQRIMAALLQGNTQLAKAP